MLTIYSLEEMKSIKEPLHLALGVFDGVHIGHQAVIKSVVDAAEKNGGVAGVLTFDPHPIRVLAPQVAPQRILASLTHKKELLEGLGVKVLVVIPFTEEFAQVEAETFLNGMRNSAAELRTLAMGEDWKFGNQRGIVERAGKSGVTDAPRAFGVQPAICIHQTGTLRLG